MKAIKEMKKGKVPGCDGLPVKFYIAFLDHLITPLMNLFEEIQCRGRMSESMLRGVMCLIPKKGKDSKFIKNLRPLRLLNMDYKILAKVLATRLKEVMPSFVGEYQTGFMARRHIQDNIRKTIDIIAHVYKSKQKALIVSIDFEKCFDRIEHLSIYKAFEYFNFGPKFIAWLRVFFTGLQICTQNAGCVSKFFVKGRGVNQGCPISPFCYNAIGELLAQEIKNNPFIRGIKVGKSEGRKCYYPIHG